MAMQALVMGFGGTGAHILTWLKELTVLKHGSKPDSIRFLLFDTIADWRPGKTVQIMGGAAEEVVAEGKEEKTSLDPATEYFYLRDHDPDLKAHVFDLLSAGGAPQKYPHLKDWLHTHWLRVHVKGASLNIVEGAAQQRQIGRFAIFQNADRIVAKVEQMIRELARHAGNSAVNVWLVGSAAGGTGAGCLLDAAYLTRKAAGAEARGGIDITVTGVIVMPDVYNDKPGISRARAYSLFRELERFQGLGIERGSAEAQMEFTSRVFYDAKKLISSSVQKGVFDDLFYIGRVCNQEKDREAFFTSAASAIDPYLDEFSGPVLIQEAVNKTAPALSFGASRLYVPEETYADIFAWEEVEKYLRGLTAHDDKRYVHSGSPGDRQENASRKVRNILPLFSELLDRAGDNEDKKRAYVKNTVTPEKIVTEWYRFDAGAIAGIQLNNTQRSAVMLTYINPYVSYVEPDVTKVAATDSVTRTYKENAEAKLGKESQDASRDRFLAELDNVTKRYLDVNAGERSLERGRRQVRDIIKANLQKKVDDLILAELSQSVKFTADARNFREGTTLTRLWAELEYALSDDGSLKKIEATIGQFIGTLVEEEAAREKQPVEALSQLKNSASGGIFSFGVWVEDYQAQARDNFYEYIRWYQKRALLRDMQKLIRDVIARFEQWARLIKQVFEHLALREPDSSLFIVKEKALKRELYGRLQRLGKNTSARISCAPFDPVDPDLDMQGYREELKKCVFVRPDETLAHEAMAASKWEAVVDEDGTPRLNLVLSSDGQSRTYRLDDLARLHQILHDQFRRRMAGALENKDIFDYLLYAQRVHNLTAHEIAKILSESADILLNARGEDECRLIYKDPRDPAKVNLADAIKGALAGFAGLIVKDSEKTHSDKNSITLLKLKKPNLDEIQDLNRCRREYLDMQVATTTGNTFHDVEVYRAQVYHPFRAELEAWYIERNYCRKHGVKTEDHQIPPRVVRLLDDPAMMQAFVHCLATQAVEKKEREEDGRLVWVWRDAQNNREVLLVDAPRADVVQAGVVFVLQQREGRRGGLIQISLEGAMRSAIDSAKSKGKTKAQMLTEFRNNLDQWITHNLAQDEITDNEIDRKRKLEERLGVRMVLDFYADADTVTELQFRMDL